MVRITVCAEDQYRAAQGIHMRQPDVWYVNDALQQADRDGFEAIYFHYKANGSLYRIPFDVLALLMDLSGDQADVHFVDPRGAK
jgi:hypothetical protein